MQVMGSAMMAVPMLLLAFATMGPIVLTAVIDREIQAEIRAVV